MVSEHKEVERLIRRKTCTQRDIAEKLGISEAYLSLLKSGSRKLNPNNPHHVKLSQKLQKLTAV